MAEKLTKLQAYHATIRFLAIYFEQTKSDDIGTLLSDTQFFAEGEIADPAAWHDCVNAALSESGGL